MSVLLIISFRTKMIYANIKYVKLPLIEHIDLYF